MAKKTKADPTGLRDRRSIATKKLQRRLKQAQKEIIKLIKDLLFIRITEKSPNGPLAVIYDYRIDAAEAETLSQKIRDVLNEFLIGVKTAVSVPLKWWWKPEIELPYRKGTVEEVVDFNKLIDEAAKAGITTGGIAIQSIPVDLVLTSPTYLSRLNDVYVENFNQIKTLSNRTADQVIQSITSGINSGLSRRNIAEQVAEKFEVSYSNAERIANTEVNKAYNDAKIRAIKDLSAATGLDAGVMHFSALTATTRETHAARHMKIYSPTEQLRWWNSGANRINCKCTIQSVLLDKQGKVVNQELDIQISE